MWKRDMESGAGGLGGVLIGVGLAKLVKEMGGDAIIGAVPLKGVVAQYRQLHVIIRRRSLRFVPLT